MVIMRFLMSSALLSSQTIEGEATIHPTDMIVLKIAAVPEDESYLISGKYSVDGAGKIKLPYLGEIIVGGFTAADTARLINERFVSQGYFTHPSVAISVRVPDPSVAEVWVGGSVQHSGNYRLKTPVTIEQALASAGG